MNIAKLIVNAIGEGEGRGIIRAIRMAYAGWMLCGHHCGTIWNWQCFKNGIDIGIAVRKGNL